MSAIAIYSDIKITTVNPITNPTIDLQLSNNKRTNIFIFVQQYDPRPVATFNFYDNSGTPIGSPLLITQPCIILFTNSKVSKFSVSDYYSYQMIIAYTIIEYYDESIINQIPSSFEIIPSRPSLTQYGSVGTYTATVGTTATQITTDNSTRKAVTVLADPSNTDTVYIGNTPLGQNFPLRAGAEITIYNVVPAEVMVRANSGTQKVYLITGGGI